MLYDLFFGAPVMYVNNSRNVRNYSLISEFVSLSPIINCQDGLLFCEVFAKRSCYWIFNRNEFNSHRRLFRRSFINELGAAFLNYIERGRWYGTRKLITCRINKRPQRRFGFIFYVPDERECDLIIVVWKSSLLEKQSTIFLLSIRSTSFSV